MFLASVTHLRRGADNSDNRRVFCVVSRGVPACLRLKPLVAARSTHNKGALQVTVLYSDIFHQDCLDQIFVRDSSFSINTDNSDTD